MSCEGVELSARARTLAMAAVLSVITLAAFWPVLHSDFISFDDGLYVTQNPHVLSGLTWSSVRWAFTTGFFGNWHPLTWLSHMFDVQCFGLNASAHHLMNLLWHLANVLLLFLLLQKLTGAPWRSAGVAALFAWHPLHVESVAWISERKDMLSTFFFLLTLWAYANFAANRNQPPERENVSSRSSRSKAALWYACALVLFACSLMSKVMTVTLPFVLLLLDYWPLARMEIKSQAVRPAKLWSLLQEKVPFLVLSFAASIIAYRAQATAHAFSLVLPLGSRLANAVASYAKYLVKTFCPVGLSVYYPHPDIRYPESLQWPILIIAVAALALGAISFAAVGLHKKAPWLITGWFWFLGTLVPVIGLVQAGSHGMADRYTYMPLIGIFICLVWSATELFAMTETGRRGLGLAAGVGLCACAVMATRQAQYWHDTATLFRHALAVNPDNAPAHFKLGSIDGSQGDFTSALNHFRAAIRADPNYVSAYYSLGMTLDGLGKSAEAVDAYQAAIRISPWWDAPHNRLGMAFSNLGRSEEACREYAEALHLNPDSADAHFNLGAALLQLGRPTEAVGHFKEAVQLNPNDPDALSGLGRALAACGQPTEAIAAYQQALSLKSSWPGALRGLAWLRATCSKAEFRNPAEALRLAQRVCQSGEKDPRNLAVLDVAYAEAGRFDDAIAAAEKTRDAAVAAGKPALASAAESRLALYRAGQPYHEGASSSETKPDKNERRSP